MKHFYESPVEPFLRRKRHRFLDRGDWRAIKYGAVFGLIVFITGLIILLSYESAHAKATYTAVIKSGVVITLAEACKSV